MGRQSPTTLVRYAHLAWLQRARAAVRLENARRAVHWTDTDTFGQVTTAGAVDQGRYSGPGAVGIAQDLRAAGLEHRAGVLPSPVPVVAGTGILLAVVVLGVVVAGPAPVRGTRWFWFWLIYLTPFGLGLLFWLARDHPWSRSVVSATAPSTVERRDRGLLGLGIGVLASLLTGAALLILHQVLGD